MNRYINMSFHAKTSTNTLSPIGIAINQIINLVHSDAHKEVVSRLLVEALHRPHRELEEMMHALHDYLLGYHLGGKEVHELYLNLKIFKPFPIELDPMNDSTAFCQRYACKCICGGIHCTEWEYDYITHKGKLYLDMGSFYRSSYIQRGTSHARINWDFLDEVEDENSTEDFVEDELSREPEMSREPSYAEATRTPSPFYATNCFCYGCQPDYYDVDDNISCATSHDGHGYDCWCASCTREDENRLDEGISRNPSPVPSNHGYGCWCLECCEGYEDDGSYDYLYEEMNPAEDDPDFAKDDRGELNYHSKRHDKREYRSKVAKKDIETQSSFKKHFKKRGARNPRPDSRHKTRNSKAGIKCGIKRTRLDTSSDEDEYGELETYEPEITSKPATEHHDNSDKPLMPEQEQDTLHFDADLPVKDDRERRLYRKHNYMREKHIRDQEKMARELGIPVARKMKRRDIPTSRYNRHKEQFDMQEC